MIAEIFQSFGIEHIVLSPGSRNGALATHFSHHPKFKTYSIVDERSAGFVALGMAQQLKKPVVVCCTSGSALVNYYPAVTEAFYQNIPLIVLSADRPAAWVDQFDGQTIRQKEVLEKHTYANIQLNESEETEVLTENLIALKKVIATSMHQSGPVHINMPFSEPLYEFQENLDIHFEEMKIEVPSKNPIHTEDLSDLWNGSDKKMVLVGLQAPNPELNDYLTELAKDDSVVIFTETTSNLHSERFFNKIDAVIFSLDEFQMEKLKPTILLTIGQNVVSKKIKTMLRSHSPEHHWHLDPYWQPDTFQCLTEKIPHDAVDFLKEFVPKILKQPSDYYKEWHQIRQEKEVKQQLFAQNCEFSDWKVFETLVQRFPKQTNIQYANSSVIRYAQLFNHSFENKINGNRGTSGIDGSTSTAIGAAMVQENQTILVTGDISFFYDSNALWNAHIPKNFRIILINNGGGNIFKIIPGPENSGVVEKVFETQHHLTAEHLAKMFEFNYEVVDNWEDLNSVLNEFYQESDQPKILEIDTTKVDNAAIMKAYFKL